MIYLLVHSPLMGPLTWAPVADRLGAAALVPSLAGCFRAGPPFAPRVVAAVGAVEGPVTVVAHSSAGLYVPVIVEALADPVAVVFAEAALPAPTGPTHPATPERLAVLRGMAEDGLLPRWTDWWDDVAPLFPDPATQAAISAEQPRLPLSYYEEPVPNPPGWARLPCTYVRFSPAYERVADEARDRGWPVVHLPGGHFHQVVDPQAVADVLTRRPG
jgi:hypothetical protein